MHLPPLVRRYGDELLAVTFAAALELELALNGSISDEPAVALLALVATLPLALRRRLPVAAFLVLWAGLFALGRLLNNGFADNSLVFLVLFVVSLYSLGAHAAGREAWAGACLVTIGVGLFAATDGDTFAPGDVIFATVLVAGPWATGVAMRLRRQRERALRDTAAQLAQDNEDAARRAVVEERARIARELHDVVSHTISMTVVQARGGRRMLGLDDRQARDAFDAIERTNAQALGDMRRLLAVLRDFEEDAGLAPAPSLARLDDLAAQLRASGLTVEVAVDGDPAALPPGVDLTAYRIIQEALTNALKHAGPSQVHVTVRYGEDDVEVTVRDDGAGSVVVNGQGHGLVGIRERVAVLGGDVELGPDPAGGGFRVQARLPYAVSS